MTEPVLTETRKGGAKVNLYEMRGANLGKFSPTQVTWAADYPTAVTALRQQGDFEHRLVLLGSPEPLSGLVSASRSRSVAVKDGYRLTAAAPGRAMVVLPIQFSHCWQIENTGRADPPRIFRANIVQTGVLFKDHAEFRLRFDFEPWRASSRLQDAKDLTLFGFR